MKIILSIFLSCIICVHVNAQKISFADYKFLQHKEDSLKKVGLLIVQGRNAADRLLADSSFTRMFVRALRTKNSFYFPFDSIINISKIYAPDSVFRMYTWQLMINENVIRQHGAIQMKTADGSFKPFVLSDKSDITKNIEDTIADNQGWIGAVYYKIILNKYNGHNYYTLFGFDENNIKADKKIMDILEFVNGKPIFGNKLFIMEKNSNYSKNAARFIMEFKKEASPKLTFDKELDAVVFDELVSETNELKKKWTLVADGEYEGFKWKDGKWIHIKNIFGDIAPKKYDAPKLMRDAKGNLLEPAKNMMEDVNKKNDPE